MKNLTEKIPVLPKYCGKYGDFVHYKMQGFYRICNNKSLNFNST